MLWRLLTIKLRMKNYPCDGFLVEKVEELLWRVLLFWQKPASCRNRGRTEANSNKINHFSTAISVCSFPVSSRGEEKLRAEFTGKLACLEPCFRGGQGREQLLAGSSTVLFCAKLKCWNTIFSSREGVLQNRLQSCLLCYPRWQSGITGFKDKTPSKFS